MSFPEADLLEFRAMMKKNGCTDKWSHTLNLYAHSRWFYIKNNVYKPSIHRKT
jgi:hypothetical protein